MEIVTETINVAGHQLEYAAITDRGLVRKYNEDNFMILPYYSIFCVADGAGGHVNGALASKLCLQSIVSHISDEHELLEDDDTVPLPVPRGETPATLLASAVHYANAEVYRQSQSGQMASTLVACQFDENGLYVAHVGDSRVYVYSDKTLHQLTEDHSLVNMLYKQGEISREEIVTHPQRNVITRAIGIEKTVEAEIMARQFFHRECYLLCTDGLTSMVTDAEISGILDTGHDNIEECCRVLVERAKANGGRDNITIILIKVCS